MQILDNRRLQASASLGHFVDFDPRQSPRPINCDELPVLVDFTAGDLGPARYTQRRHSTTLEVGRIGKDLELHVPHGIGEIGEFELDPKIRLVTAKPADGLRVGHDREWLG